jgi:nucleoside recognition membrane protein YjiH
MITEVDTKQGESAKQEIMPVTLKRVLRFAIPSLIGVALFLTPLNIDGKMTLLIAFLISSLNFLLKDYILSVNIFITVVPAILSVAFLLTKSLKSSSNRFIQLLNPGYFWVIVRIVGAISIFLIYFKVGPEWIWHKNTGGIILFDLAPVILVMYFMSAILLPFLTNYGLMEFIGTLVNKGFNRLFGLPGAAAVDAFASWLSSSSIGIIITTQQYRSGYYSKREAAAITTNFSVVAIAFAYIVLSFIKLEHLFIPWYLSVIAAGFVCAMILPRISPLKNISNTYHADKKTPRTTNQLFRESTYKFALRRGLERADTAPPISAQLKNGVLTALDIAITVFPTLMIVGVGGLAIIEFTSIVSTIAIPLIPILELLQLPEAPLAATAIVAGLIDMLMPAIIGASIESELTRFVVAGVAINGIIFFSEVAIILIRANIGLNIINLIIIWILRVLITLPVLTILGRIILS